jgi:alpha-L-fucosidase 2
MDAYVNRTPANNLHNSGANQSDASFGYTAAGAEALVQSCTEEINKLLALPPQWPDGSVQGLRARGGNEVNMEWKNGKLLSAQISNRNGGSCTVRYGDKTTKASANPAEPRV